MRIAVPHFTTQQEARKRVEARLDDLVAQFGHNADERQHEWTGDTLRFKGKAKGLKVEGTLEITPAEVIIDAKLPFIANMFEGRIRSTVQKEADALFKTA
jgi:putative polyhydroxyalkanoate system protein